MNLFQLGDFTGHSGDTLHWKIECDALTDADLACLAFMLSERLPAFGPVVGIPRGGLRLAEALVPYSDPMLVKPRLIVDDVLTSGGSMTQAVREWAESDGWELGWPPEGEYVGAVLFARRPCPSWITPLFQMGPPLR